LGSFGLGVEHDVANGWIAVAEEVIHDKDRTSIEMPIFVVRIASFLMCVHEPVQKVDELVFEAHDADTGGVDVEGHVIVTLDVHELVIQSQ
jgi:hypothetical protein